MRAEILNDLDNVMNFVENAIDFHCHGVGNFDFTEIKEIELDVIENILKQRQEKAILTVYLPKPNFEHFLDLMNFFDQGRRAGKYKHIQGFGLEGPLLASHGGTPEKGVWVPTRDHWKALAACGSKGLIYVIFSPDAYLPGSNFKFNADSVPVADIAELLIEGGVLPTPGHFIKNDPKESANQLQTIFDVVAASGIGPTITDHLYNDMPRNFKHAWRTPEEKKSYSEDIKALDLDSWSFSNLEEKVGIVPATMMRNARKGIVKLCQNFDGEHVDLAIVKKTVELVGAENMLFMTDSIESQRLAGRHLLRQDDSGLLYQDEGIVAAGSQNIPRQIKNMMSIGLSDEQIDWITHRVPASIVAKHGEYTHGQITADSL